MAELKALVTEVALPKSPYHDMALQLLHELYNHDVPKPYTLETIVVRPLPPDDDPDNTTDDGPNDGPNDGTDDGSNEGPDEEDDESESEEESDDEDDEEELEDPKEGAPG